MIYIYTCTRTTYPLYYGNFMETFVGVWQYINSDKCNLDYRVPGMLPVNKNKLISLQMENRSTFNT